MKKNEELDLDIIDLSSEGTGIGKVDNFVVYVENALPGERVRTLIIKVTAQYAVGKLLKRLGDPSPWRDEVLCPYYAQCGGCQIMHLCYEKQLEIKREWVKNCMSRIGGFRDIEIQPVLGMEHPWNYRNKGSYPVGPSEKGRGASVGMYAQRSHRIIPLTHCAIQDERIRFVLEAVKGWMHDFKVEGYREESHSGVVRHIIGRVGHETGEVMAVIVSRTEKVAHTDELISVLRRNVRGLASVILNINSKPGNTILGSRSITLWGKDTIEDKIGNVSFSISPHSFFQVNPEQTRVLYDTVKNFAALTGIERVYDAYCGVGTIGQYVADGAAELYGVEEVPQAIDAARENAVKNGVHGAHYTCGRAEEIFPEWVKKGNTPDVLIVDPPRKGCQPEFLRAASECEPSRIVYVSCNPATLARDAALLAENGYRIERVQPVDMFPQTTGIETVVLFKSTLK